MIKNQLNINKLLCILLFVSMLLKKSQSGLLNASKENGLIADKEEDKHEQLAMKIFKRFEPFRKQPEPFNYQNQVDKKKKRKKISKVELNNLIMLQRIMLAIGR